MGGSDFAALQRDYPVGGCAGYDGNAVADRALAVAGGEFARRPEQAPYAVPADRAGVQHVSRRRGLAVPAALYHGHVEVPGLPTHSGYPCGPPYIHLDAAGNLERFAARRLLLSQDDGVAQPPGSGRHAGRERLHPAAGDAQSDQRVDDAGRHLPSGGRRGHAHVGRPGRGPMHLAGTLRGPVLRTDGLRRGRGRHRHPG
mmetsp:Transcript_66785/g.131400  ORF Transcript_66785/g.131400 Transcript_66785/m.131400 type:complete len:200 (-) Transcript_66785:213-812(-)